MKHKRYTFRRRQHLARNDQLPPFGQEHGPRFVIHRGQRVTAPQGRAHLNRGTGKGTERALARERAMTESALALATPKYGWQTNTIARDTAQP